VNRRSAGWRPRYGRGGRRACERKARSGPGPRTSRGGRLAAAGESISGPAGRRRCQARAVHHADRPAAGGPCPGGPIPPRWTTVLRAMCGRPAGTECAVRRFVASLMQLGGTWRSVPGSPGWP